MNPDQIKSKILDFIKQQKLCVISTIDTSGQKTESAVVGVAETDSLELIFGTANTTRKYRNLQQNPHASFVIGWDPRLGTVQYEGTVKEVSGDEAVRCADIMVAKNPFSAKFRENPDQRYFIVTPTWARLTDLSVSPEQISEVIF